MKTGTEDTEGVYGGGMELRCSLTEAGSPQARPHPPWLAWSSPSLQGRGPVDYSLSVSPSTNPTPTTRFLLPVSKSQGKWQRVNMVQAWHGGILGKTQIPLTPDLSRDWGRDFRNPHPCILFSLWVFLPKC